MHDADLIKNQWCKFLLDCPGKNDRFDFFDDLLLYKESCSRKKV